MIHIFIMKPKFCNFHIRTVHLDIIKVFFYLPTYAQDFWFKRNIKIHIKNVPTCFGLTLNPLTWKIWWALNNASKWQMGFNSAFKGLIVLSHDPTGIRPHKTDYHILINHNHQEAHYSRFVKVTVAKTVSCY